MEAQIARMRSAFYHGVAPDHDLAVCFSVAPDSNPRPPIGLPPATTSVHPRAGGGQGGYSERVAGLFEVDPTPYSSALGTGVLTSSSDPFLLLFHPDHPRD